MTLVVDVPPGHDGARRYILDVVLSEWLGLDWQPRATDRPEVRIRARGADDGPAVVLPDVLFDPRGPGWLTPASLPGTPLRVRDGVPVLYGRDGPVPTAAGPGEVRLDIDVFGSAFFMLSRYEEAVLPDRDQHGRFPAAASLAHRAGFLDRPVVDLYVDLLWAALVRCWPRLRRPERDYRVLLTHDVDDPVSRFGRTPYALARQLAADVLRRRAPGLAARRARALLERDAEHARDPHNTFDLLTRVSERAGLRSAFYFQSHAEPDYPGGANYALDHPWISRLLRRVHDRGHEVGYHAGFGTYRDPDRTAAEFQRLRAAAERAGVRQDRWGGRQHYLQWAPATWTNWAGAGLDYDCTVAYADAVGFRTGTCHEFPVYDLAADAPLPLRERPFQIMDVTLFGYLGLDADGAMAAVQRVAAECRRHHGSLGILWHNDSHLRTAREQRWYADMVQSVTAGA